ncbi:MAG: M48 family metalloprotease [Mariprofundaceae bacterium]|nr:M48 family metalloprotease [Mariprofundaceae bacterium]
METMEGLIVLATLIGSLFIYALSIYIRLWYCKKKLKQHIHVNDLERALPVHAVWVYKLLQELSLIAAIHPPKVFVYRAELPNAFVAAMPLRSEIYIADELFEEANASHDPIDTLAQTLAHEIAHLKLNHAFTHAIYTYLSYQHIPMLSDLAKNKLRTIEQEADDEAERIVSQLHNFNSSL